MGVLFTNNASTTLSAAISSTSATSISVASSSTFPAPGAGEYFYATIDDGTNNEIVKVTAVSGTTWTVVRASDNTTARTFSSGDTVQLRAAAALLTDIQQNIAAKSANQTVYNATTASSATTYDVGTNPQNENNAMVFLDGVMQHHDTFSFSGSTLTFDAAPSNGLKLEVIIDNLINLQSSNLTVDTFTATNGQTAFTLSDTPAAEDNLIVFIEGVFQNQDSYSISNNVLTMSAGVTTGRKVVIYVINPVNIGTPSDGTVTSAKLSGNITTPGTLTVGSYDVAFDSPTFVVDNSNSRVGLGTASPSVPVDIVGDVKMSSTLDLTSHLDMPDSANIKLGTGDDLLLYHDGTNSYIANTTGALKIATETSGIAVTIGHTTSETTVADNLTVTGTITGTLATAAQTNITSLGTLTTLTVDDITINGSTISDSGEFTIDTGDSIVLDADGAIVIKNAGSAIGRISNSSSNMYIQSDTSDADILIRGNDGGSTITALTLDMSNAGTATFNHDIKLPDSGEINLGAGSDLKLYHDGSNSYIANEFGVLYIDQRVQDGNFIFRNDDGSGGNAEYIVLDGGGEEIKMKKKTWFEGSTNLYVDLFADSGTSQGTVDLRFYTDGASAKQTVAGIVMQQEDGTSRKGEILLQVADNGSPATALKIFNNKNVYGYGGLYSYHDGTDHMALRALSGGQYIQYGSGRALSFVAIDTFPNSGASTKMTLTTGGELLVGSTSELSPNARVFINANSNSTNPALNLKAATTTSSGSVLIFFAGDNDEVGSVSMSNLEQGTGVAYNTSSDARLKNVTGKARGLEVINALNPVAFDWKKTGVSDEGLIAQEVEHYIPNIVQEGNNGYYQLDYGKLVTPLIKAVQEQQKQIEELKQEIEAVKDG